MLVLKNKEFKLKIIVIGYILQIIKENFCPRHFIQLAIDFFLALNFNWPASVSGLEIDNVSSENENLEVELPDHENSNSGNTETLNKTKNFFGIPGKAIRLSESTKSGANATITQSNAKNVATKNLEKTENSKGQ